MHFSHQCPEHNSKMNSPKVFKLDIGNDLGIFCKVGVRVNTNVSKTNDPKVFKLDIGNRISCK